LGNDPKWVVPLDKLRFKERIGVLASLNSFKKGMPDPCKCSLRKLEDVFLERASRPFVPSKEYLMHCVRTVRRLFQPGWDNGYEKSVASNSPPLTSCVGSKRAELGAFGIIRKSELDQYSLGERPIVAYDCDLQTIVSAGKARVLVKTPASWNALRPLHQSIYDHLSREDWLLRGKPSLKRIGKLMKGMKKDEMLISGDYESATDLLSIEVAETLLSEMKRSSRFVPSLVWEGAVKSLRPFINAKSGRYEVKRGQMMGSLLSFPLLCLQNYCATTYILGDRPMLINGDDLATRGTKKEYEKWLAELPKLGLVPSVAKCGFRRSVITINSEYFQLIHRRAARIPCFRGRGLSLCPEGITQGNAFAEHRGAIRGKMRERYDRRYIEVHAKELCMSGRSMLRLGWDPMPGSVPRWAAVREWTIARPGENPLPPAPTPHEGVAGIPEGWKRVTERVASNSCEPFQYQLIRREQGRIWAEGKNARGHGGGRGPSIAKSTNQDWKAWCEEVRATGVRPVRYERRVYRWEMKSWRPGFGPVMKTTDPPVYRRLCPPKREIGRHLRDLQLKKAETSVKEYLIPETWRRRKIDFVFGGRVSSA
jgi:hypothetical protein